MAANDNISQLLPWEQHDNSTLLYSQVVGLLNTIYYLLLIPVATVGNLLTLLVVIYIVRNDRKKRSVPDLWLGVVAVIDIVSVFLVHPMTLGAMYRTEWTYPRWACLYQGYAASVYMKMEFIVQVLISLDRHFALVRPLRYHTFNSLVTFKVAVICACVFAVGTTSLTFSFGSSRVKYIETWQFCAPAAQFDTLPDIILNTIVSAVFVSGIITFIVCNVTLVNILRHYHKERANCLLQQISDAMEAMKKEHGRTRNGKPAPHKRTSPPKVLRTHNSQIQDNGDKNLHQNMTIIEDKHSLAAAGTLMKVINGNLKADVTVGFSHGKFPSQSIPNQSQVESGLGRNEQVRLHLSPLCYNAAPAGMESGTCIDINCGGELNKMTAPDQVIISTGDTAPSLDPQILLTDCVITRGSTGASMPQIRLECQVNDKTDECKCENQSDLTSIGNQSALFGDVGRHSVNNTWTSEQVNSVLCLPMGEQTVIRKSHSFTEGPAIFDQATTNIHKSASVGDKKGFDCRHGTLFDNCTASVSSVIFPCAQGDLDARFTDIEARNSTEFSYLDSTTPNKTSPILTHPPLTTKTNDAEGAIVESTAANQNPACSVLANGNGALTNRPSTPVHVFNTTVNHKGATVAKAPTNQNKPSLYIPGSSTSVQKQTSNTCKGLPKSRVSKTSTSSQRTNGFAKSNGLGLSPGSPPGSPPAMSSSTESWDPARAQYIQQQMAKFLKKMEKKARKQKRELLLAKMVVLCATVFIITWLPYITVTILSFCDITASTILTDISLKLVFLNALLNPVFYGLCRKTYRKGFSYLVQLSLHYVCCGSVDRPGEDKVFFDSRKKKQKRHLEAAMFDVQVVPKVCHRQPALDRSAHALLLLQHTLNMRPVSPAIHSVKGHAEFIPSRQLQELYERYMLESDSSSSDDTSTVDYEALVFGDGELYHNLQKVWSMCYNADIDDVNIIDDVIDETESDIDLDIDYDALLGDNEGEENMDGACLELESVIGLNKNSSVSSWIHHNDKLINDNHKSHVSSNTTNAESIM